MDPIIKLNLMTNGDLRIALGSQVKKGLYSQSMLTGARSMTEQEIRRGTTILVMAQMKHQGNDYGDDHDGDDTIKVLQDALTKIFLDGATEVWRNPVTFSAREKGGGKGIATSKVRKLARPDWL